MAEWTDVLATVEISICVGAPAAKLSPLATNAALLLPETHLAVIVMLLLLCYISRVVSIDIPLLLLPLCVACRRLLMIKS
jgi:hypothetical protein